MDAQTVAGVIASLRMVALLVLSLICCFGLVWYFLSAAIVHRKALSPDARHFYVGEFLLMGGTAVWLWRSLLYHPVLLFAPIAAFFVLCLRDRKTDGNRPC